MAKLTDEERKLFEEPNLCAVSTLGRDGYPHVTMAWIDVDGDDVLLNSAEHRGWPKNLKRDPGSASASSIATSGCATSPSSGW